MTDKLADRIAGMSFQELEDLCERNILKLGLAAAEIERRTCAACEARGMAPAVNAAATEFYSDVLRAKASGTRLAILAPDVTVKFGGK